MELVQDYVTQSWNYINNFHFVKGKTWGTDGKYVVILSFSYLVVYFLLKAYMKTRSEAFKHPLLTVFIVVHNAILSLGSFTLLLGIAYEIYKEFAVHGAQFEVLYCDAKGTSHINTIRPGPINFYFWIFFLSKYYELIDTIILLLKKKEVIFLHVYHHFITIYIAWACMSDNVAATWSSVITNLAVHTAMYYYYAAAALRIDVSWKQHLTTMQIVQFLIDLGFGYGGIYVYWSNGWTKCQGSKSAWVFAQGILFSFLLLFIQFFIDTYIYPKKREGGQSRQPSGRNGTASKPKKTD